MDTLIAVGERGAVLQEKLASFPGLSLGVSVRSAHLTKGKEQNSKECDRMHGYHGIDSMFSTRCSYGVGFGAGLVIHDSTWQSFMPL